MEKNTTFMTVKEVMDSLEVSESKAYRIIRSLNKELKDKGYIVIAGRVSRQYFNERFYGMVKAEEGVIESAGI